MFLSSDCCFQLKYESSIHNIVSPAKSSESGEKYAMIKHSLQAKSVQNGFVGRFWCERQQRIGFSLEEAIWIIKQRF